MKKNRKVLAELKAIGARSMAVTIDLTKREEFEPAFQRIENELGSVDILVNNAGNVSLSGGVMHESPEDWDCVLATQLTPSFFFPGSRPRGCSAGKWGRSSNRQYVLVFRFWSHTFLQRRKRCDYPAHEIHGN
jgi:3-oxoacyl-[acyl-carrier protein] reductase